MVEFEGEMDACLNLFQRVQIQINLYLNLPVTAYILTFVPCPHPCSGRDILISAALGADEFGFGTVAMIATGCIMARVCHTNNCPVGVASQREELRARFPGAPADLVNYFHFVAEEVRQGLAQLGLRSEV